MSRTARTATTLYRPTSPEATLGLLHDTWVAALEDGRICAEATAAAGLVQHTDESECEAAQRAWRLVLPTKQDPWYDVRTTFGWTVIEINRIEQMLAKVAVALHRQGHKTAVERLNRLRDEWAALSRRTR